MSTCSAREASVATCISAESTCSAPAASTLGSAAGGGSGPPVGCRVNESAGPRYSGGAAPGSGGLSPVDSSPAPLTMYRRDASTGIGGCAGGCASALTPGACSPASPRWFAIPDCAECSAESPSPAGGIAPSASSEAGWATLAGPLAPSLGRNGASSGGGVWGRGASGKGSDASRSPSGVVRVGGTDGEVTIRGSLWLDCSDCQEALRSCVVGGGCLHGGAGVGDEGHPPGGEMVCGVAGNAYSSALVNVRGQDKE